MQKLRYYCWLLIILMTSLQMVAQDHGDLFDSKVPIIWLGVDFSEMKFIGPATGWGVESTKSASEMRDTYFHVWNEFIKKEHDKFKVEQSINRLNVEMDIEMIKKINNKANKKDIFSESTLDYQQIDEEQVKKMVKLYDCKGKTGIGFVLIAEGMNKNLEEASYWATFFSMKNNKVILAKRVTGKAVGFGFRNYWLGSIKNVFKGMKKEFKTWE